MKNIVIILFICINGLNAQRDSTNFCWNVPKTLTTRWDVVGSPNTWDWTTNTSIRVYPSDFTDVDDGYNLQHPMWCLQNGGVGTGGCNNGNLISYGAFNRDVDMLPENGWELLLKDFGRPNTNGQSNGIGARTPFYALYNRFTGKIKIFIAIMGNVNAVQNDAHIQVGFLISDVNKNIIRDALGHAIPITRSLENFDNTNFFKLPNEFVNGTAPQDYYWLVGDIQTSYDPCTCTELATKQSNPSYAYRKSELQFQSFLTTITNMEASIDGMITQAYQNQSGEFDNSPPERTGFKNFTDGAISGYKSWDGYRGYIQPFLNGLDEKRKRKRLTEWYNANRDGVLLNDNVPFKDLPTQFQMTLFSDWLSSDDSFKKLMGFTSSSNLWSVTGSIVGAAPYVGLAYGAFNGLFGGGEKSTPMAFRAQLKLRGTLSTPFLKSTIPFYLPGSNDIANADDIGKIPFYNNTLGVFNLLKSPKIEYAKINFNIDILNPPGIVTYGPGFNDVDDDQFMQQFKLKEEIRYVVNPQSDMIIDLIDAAYIFEYKGSEPLYLKDEDDWAQTRAIPYYEGIGGDNNQLTLDQRLDKIEATSGLEVEYMSANYPSADTSIIRFRTSYVPLSCLKNVNILTFGRKSPKVFIKMIIRMHHRDDPQRVYINVVTYDISNSFLEATKNDVEGTAIATLGFDANGFIGYYHLTDPYYASIAFSPIDLPFFNPTYFSSFTKVENGVTYKYYRDSYTIPDNSVIPSNTTFISGDIITIGQNVSFGQNVTLKARNAIESPPISNFINNVILEVQPNIGNLLFGCTNYDPSSLRAGDWEIDRSCKSALYKANITPNRPAPQVEVPVVVSENNLSAAPNPFEDALVLTMDLVTDSEVSVMAYDMVGHLIETIQVPTAFAAGEYKLIWNASNLPAGLYFVTLQGNDFRKTIKVIKQ